jgi:Icc protein
MPIHLGQINRREFLGRALSAGAGLATTPALFGESKSTDPAFWVLFSDTHIAADRKLVSRGTNMADNLRWACQDVLSLEHSPTGIFVNGDCAYSSGQLGDYSAFIELIAPLRDQTPIHLSLGNHDNRERFWQALPGAKRAVHDRQVSLLKTPHANWFILDSLEETSATPGLLGTDQLDWLAKTLDSNPTQPAIVMIHHNPGISGNMGLKDTVALFEVIRQRKQVKSYIYGHTHSWKVEKDQSGIHLVNLPPVSYVFAEDQPSGWVQATLGNDGIRLVLRCKDAKHKANGETFDLKWRNA